MIILAVEITIIALSLSGFISQLRLLRRENNLGTFSIYVPGVILLASILKIFFWIIKPFAVSILVQSFLLIAVLFLLLKECIKLRQYKPASKGGLLGNFWNWETLAEYTLFMLGFSLTLGILTYISIADDLPIIGDIFGYASTVLELYLAIPQIYSSFKNKSVEGVSHTMISIWIFIDCLKTGYFISNEQPLQFILTGAIQIVFDLVLIGQIFSYGGSSPAAKAQAKTQ